MRVRRPNNGRVRVRHTTCPAYEKITTAARNTSTRITNLHYQIPKKLLYEMIEVDSDFGRRYSSTVANSVSAQLDGIGIVFLG